MLDDYDYQSKVDLHLIEPNPNDIPEWQFEGFWLGDTARQMHRALDKWGITFWEFLAQPSEYWRDMFVIEDIINTKTIINLEEKRKQDPHARNRT